MASTQADTSPSSTAPKKSSHHASSKSASHSSSKNSTHKGKKSKKTAGKRGQQKIDAERAQQIQAALIREHYLEGKPTGKWDDATQKAMEKYQADNGWQSKTVPDSRALIKMGLGPNQDHLLNPESAMTSNPSSQHPATSGPNAAGIPELDSQPQK